MTDMHIQRVTYKDKDAYLALYDQKSGLHKLIFDDGRVAFVHEQKNEEQGRIKVLNAVGNFDIGLEVKAIGKDKKWYQGHVTKIDHKDKRITVEYKGADGKKHTHSFGFEDRYNNIRYMDTPDKGGTESLTGKGEAYRKKYIKEFDAKSKYPYGTSWNGIDGGVIEWHKIREVLDRFDFPDSNIIVDNETAPSFDLNDKKFTTAGLFHPDRYAITLYPKNIHSAHAGRITAHEATHAMFHMFGGGPTLTRFMDMRDELSKDDGHTAYSAEWWKNYMDHPTDDMYTAAVNETLAEISAVEYGQADGDKPVSSLWKKFHAALMNESVKFKKRQDAFRKLDEQSKIWIWNKDSANTSKWEHFKTVKTNQAEKWLKKLRAEHPKETFIAKPRNLSRPTEQDYRKLTQGKIA